MTPMPVRFRCEARTDGSGAGRGIGPLALERGGFDVERELGQKSAPPRIRCPHCRWQPRRSSTWTCLSVGHPEHLADGCGHSWNTFDTRGRCPGCRHQWVHTSCLACGRWARHEDWYEPQGDGDTGLRGR